MRTKILLAALLALHPVMTAAQELESIAGVRLNFDRAGTRALGMGATGIATKSSDDVTMNPASIAGAEKSLSLELSRNTMESRYVSDKDLHTVGLDSTATGLHNVSLTYPMAGWTWALFYEEPIEVDHSTRPAFVNGSSAGLLVCDGHLVPANACNGPEVYFNLPATFPIDSKLSLQRYGAAAAWSRGPVAFGAALRREHLRQDAVNVFTLPLLFFTYPGPSETTDDSAYTWSAGLTWDVTPRTRAGASYSSGGSFTGARTAPESSDRPIEFRTPPTAGFGLSFDPIPQLTLAADVVRVQYSAMMHGGRNFVLPDTQIGYPDVTEWHAGAEYRLGTVSLRAGWWRDPDHALSVSSGPLLPPLQYVAAIVHSDEDHLTAGLGIGGKTRLDASVDRSARSTRLALGVSTKF